MDEKVVRFDLSAETLIGLAEKKLDEKDYVGALRILRKSVEENGATADEYAVFADIYDEMELFENAVNYWFRFLDVCEEDEVVDGYEGLAACFYNMGNERQAIYYYNLMLQDKYVSAENNIEMGELFSEPAKKRFRIVYPPEEADYSEELDEGLSALRSGDFAKSDEIFSAVPQGASCYGAARNFYALSKLMQGNAEEAEAVCRARLAEDGEDVSVLATYAAALTELGRKEESRRTAQKLASLPAASADELYKIATVCCENKLYDDIQSVLQHLINDGKKLIVATSKPQIFAERILDHFNLTRYFDYVSGATLDSSRVEKSDIIAFALKNFAVSPQSAVMVGDRKHDIIGAKANGLKSVGVLYGYGDEAELLSAGADYIATMPKDIIKIADRH